MRQLIGFFRMTCASSYDPHRMCLVVNHVPDAAATSHFDLPLLQLLRADFPGGKVVAKPVMPGVLGRPRVGAHQLVGIPSVAGGLAAEVVPASCRLIG